MKTKNHIVESSKAIRGLERKDYFASGGTLTGWRGQRPTVTIDRKKRASKNKCRGRIQCQ